MKKKTILKSVLILAVAAGTAAFTSTMEKKIDISESSIEWKGKKVLGSHTGTINLQDGHLEMEGDQLTGGKFTVDMTSITVTDLKGEDKGKLEGHLKSDDFFGVENHPTAQLVINNATKDGNTYTVTGDITIKGKTEPVTFDLIMGESAATTSFKIDRTKFGVRYGSGSFFDNLGDNTISNDFTLDVTLKF
ncbi:YceI family protein [Marixanthomonas ophiurae]|uniref:YceI family protein n=1 Tax=Marixanthomonas ophiurae TaxID=387659 RepID=A0A3E1Q8X8_9FLAO|nr:YceI family protein [Marixanthomonas ophiurae]RFN58586.1 YceI family protein [Marixanthomonas ophiurae]